MLCPNCGKDCDAGAAFCANCGTDLPGGAKPSQGSRAACPACGAKNEADALLCSLCGATLPAGEKARASSRLSPVAPAPESGSDASATAFLAKLFGCGVLLLALLGGGGWFGWHLWNQHAYQAAKQRLVPLLATFDEATAQMALSTDGPKELESSFAFLESYRNQARDIAANPAVSPADRERVLADVYRSMIDLYDLCDSAWADENTETRLAQAKTDMNMLERISTNPDGSAKFLVVTKDGRELRATDHARESAANMLYDKIRGTRPVFIHCLLITEGSRTANVTRKVHGILYVQKLLDLAGGFGHSMSELSAATLDARFAADLRPEPVEESAEEPAEPDMPTRFKAVSP